MTNRLDGIHSKIRQACTISCAQGHSSDEMAKSSKSFEQTNKEEDTGARDAALLHRVCLCRVCLWEERKAQTLHIPGSVRYRRAQMSGHKVMCPLPL